MTRDQDIILTSSCTTRDYLNLNASIVNTLPYGASNLVLLNSTINLIFIEAEIQETSKKGYTDHSNNLKDKLVFEAADTARKLITFAKFSKNLILLAEIRSARRKLGKGAKTDVVKNAQIVYDRAQSNLATLQGYNITTGTQTNLSTSIAAFTAVLGKTGTGRTEKSQSTERLRILFKTLRSTITALSDAIEIIRSTKADFYKGFKTAKKRPSTRTSKPMLKGMVVDTDGNAIESMSIMIFLLDANKNPIQDKKKIIKRKTRKSGRFNIQNTADGNYLILLKNLKFAEEKVELSLAKGQIVNFKVVMKSIID